MTAKRFRIGQQVRVRPSNASALKRGEVGTLVLRWESKQPWCVEFADGRRYWMRRDELESVTEGDDANV